MFSPAKANKEKLVVSFTCSLHLLFSLVFVFLKKKKIISQKNEEKKSYITDSCMKKRRKRLYLWFRLLFSQLKRKPCEVNFNSTNEKQCQPFWACILTRKAERAWECIKKRKSVPNVLVVCSNDKKNTMAHINTERTFSFFFAFRSCFFCKTTTFCPSKV